jgi:hypothetical protein
VLGFARHDTAQSHSYRHIQADDPENRLSSFALGVALAGSFMAVTGELPQRSNAGYVQLVGILLLTWSSKNRRPVDETDVSERQRIFVGALLFSGFAVMFASLAVSLWQAWQLFQQFKSGVEPTLPTLASVYWLWVGLGLVAVSLGYSVYVGTKKISAQVKTFEFGAAVCSSTLPV